MRSRCCPGVLGWRRDLARAEASQRQAERQAAAQAAARIERERREREVAERRRAEEARPLEGHYEVRGSRGEIIRDTSTGLEWQRCSLVQTWDGRTCTGDATTYNWNDARAAANRVSGWRLPSKDELRTLVHCSSGQPARFKNNDVVCSDSQYPSIAAAVLPRTAAGCYWSSSPHGANPTSAWYVSFGNGGAFNGNRKLANRVRLVRSGQ